jgi:hypothetical protein
MSGSPPFTKVTNPQLATRLGAIIGLLRSAHTGGTGLSSSVKGTERESFIKLVLSNVIPTHFRIGTGEVTDQKGRASGQVDIIIEYAQGFSFPLMQGLDPRLYLAECVCAVIEVKSNLSTQWDEVAKKAALVASLQRSRGMTASVGRDFGEGVPIFAIGYEGYASLEMLRTKANEVNLAGILQINEPLYAGGDHFEDHSAIGTAALYGFYLSLEEIMSTMMWSKPPYGGYVSR